MTEVRGLEGYMILPEEIGYECEIQENVSAEDIKQVYDDGIIIWLNGSGTSPEGKPGAYRCVLYYKGHAKFLEKELAGATANQVMIDTFGILHQKHSENI